MKRAPYITRVKILLSDPLARGTGLAQDSVIMADSLTTLELQFVVKKIGAISDMTLVDNALRKVLAL